MREMSVALLRLQFDSRAVDRSAVVLNESLRERFFFTSAKLSDHLVKHEGDNKIQSHTC